MSGCKLCKTVQVTERRHVGGFTKATPGAYYLAVVGAKHTCGRCPGEIEVADSKTTGTMAKRCPSCGPQAVYCKVAVEKAAKS